MQTKYYSIGYKQRILAIIARLKSCQENVQHRIWCVSGSGLNETVNTAQSFLRWQPLESAFNCRITTGLIANIQHIEPTHFLRDCKSLILENIRQHIEIHTCIKVNTILNAEFSINRSLRNENNDTIIEEETDIKNFTTSNITLKSSTDLEIWYEEKIVMPTLSSLEDFQERDSGWALSKIINILININKCVLLTGSHYIKLPKTIQMKRAVVNVCNDEDDNCFAVAVVSALYPALYNANRITSYPHYEDVLNLNGISFPVSLKDISIFEKNNQISINVYILERKPRYVVLPLRLSSLTHQYGKHINLLLYIDPKTEEKHYCWIRNLSRLVSSQINKHGHAKHICDR